MPDPSSILASPAPIAPIAPKPPVELRDVGDSTALRKAIYNSSLKAVQSWKPVDYGGVRLELHEPHFDGPEDYSMKDQKKAILERGTLGRRIRGTWQLSDINTGAVLDRKKTTLANIPYLTPRGTFIDNGNEYSLISQSRLRPGIYSRRKENGEFESFVSVRPHQGISHRYFLDPEKGVFFTNIGAAKIPLVPLLHAMGVGDRELQHAWGPEIAARNAAVDQPHLMRKYHERFLSSQDKDLPETEKTEKVIARLAGMELDPEVTSRTMPKPYTNLNRDSILDITKRLLAISKGEAETDNRDDLAYQHTFGPEDNIAERLEKDYGNWRRKLAWRAARDKSLRAAIPGYLNPQVRSALLQSGLGQHLEETNLGEILDKQFRITRTGEGGLGGDNIPASSREVQNSYLNYIDSLKTPESSSIGVDLYLARGVKKGSDGKLYAPFIDPKTGKTDYHTPQDTAKLTVAFPGELKKPGKRAWAIRNGKIVSAKREDIDLIVPNFEGAFTPLSNLVPMKSGIKGQRASMTGRFITQALPLVGAEAPLVQSGVPGEPNRSFEQHYGEKLGAVYAKQPAKVMSVGNEEIKLRYGDGREEAIELAHKFPMNRRTFYEQTPVGEEEPETASSTYLEQYPAVKVGDTVQPGQLLAHSNYTDKKGHIALGMNARVAYLAGHANHEDAITISDSFAKKLLSDHMFPYRFEPGDTHKLGRGSFLSLFPHKFDRRQLEAIDDNGLVKPGTTVQYGDPLILGVGEKSAGAGRVHKRGSSSFSDASVTWDKKSPGTITDAVRSKNGAMTVLVRSQLATQVADKLSSRWAAKGVIGKIVPDDKMPHDSEGNPIEVLLNPHGIPSRGNPSAIIETVLGKIAAKTGVPYKIQDFEDIDDLAGFAQQELAKHGMSDLEDLTDPQTGRKIKDVLTGRQFIMKLHHLSAEKQHGRGTGSYTALGSPARGEGKSKRLSGQESNALLAAGGYATLRDASQIRGQRNEDFWLNFMQGYSPPEPQVPLVYKKFVADLQASGINVVSKGTTTNIMAMTDRDVDKLAGDREVKSGELVDASRGMRPVPGGLFDEGIFGKGGNRFGYIKTAEPIVNPVMEDPVRHLLGLTKNQLEDVIAGKMEIPGHKGTGTPGIAKALGSLNVPMEIARTRLDIQRRRGSGRDAAVRKLGYLLGSAKNQIHPGDWVVNKVPVLPPAFRQVGMMGDTGIPIIPDANYLYRELIEANDNLKSISGQVSDVGPERLALYHAHKALVGLGDPLSKKLKEKRIGGILSKLLGSSPKFSTVQRRLLSQTVDLVGRATLIPNPDLDLDSVSIPEEKAWDVYKNFVVRRLRRRGMPVSEAMRQVENKSPLARNEMLGEMGDRPVLVSRAPVLHRYGIQAFWPRLTKSTAIELSPLVFSGFGADADGDALNWHVPVEDEAVREAKEKLLPSRSLVSPADFKTPAHSLSQEYVGALHHATQHPDPKKKERKFDTKEDAIRAWRRGELALDEPVHISKH